MTDKGRSKSYRGIQWTPRSPSGVRREKEWKRDWPRLMTRKMAAEYMGRCPKTFDKIKHKYAVDVGGLIRYDRVLMDRDIDLNRLVA